MDVWDRVATESQDARLEQLYAETSRTIRSARSSRLPADGALPAELCCPTCGASTARTAAKLKQLEEALAKQAELTAAAVAERAQVELQRNDRDKSIEALRATIDSQAATLAQLQEELHLATAAKQSMEAERASDRRHIVAEWEQQVSDAEAAAAAQEWAAAEVVWEAKLASAEVGAAARLQQLRSEHAVAAKEWEAASTNETARAKEANKAQTEMVEAERRRMMREVEAQVEGIGAEWSAKLMAAEADTAAQVEAAVAAEVAKRQVALEAAAREEVATAAAAAAAARKEEVIRHAAATAANAAEWTEKLAAAVSGGKASVETARKEELQKYEGALAAAREEWKAEHAAREAEWEENMAKAVAAAGPDGSVAAMLESMAAEHQAALQAQQAAANSAATERETTALTALSRWEEEVSQWEGKVVEAEAIGAGRLQEAAAQYARESEIAVTEAVTAARAELLAQHQTAMNKLTAEMESKLAEKNFKEDIGLTQTMVEDARPTEQDYENYNSADGSALRVKSGGVDDDSWFRGLAHTPLRQQLQTEVAKLRDMATASSRSQQITSGKEVLPHDQLHAPPPAGVIVQRVLAPGAGVLLPATPPPPPPSAGSTPPSAYRHQSISTPTTTLSPQECSQEHNADEKCPAPEGAEGPIAAALGSALLAELEQATTREKKATEEFQRLASHHQLETAEMAARVADLELALQRHKTPYRTPYRPETSVSTVADPNQTPPRVKIDLRTKTSDSSWRPMFTPNGRSET